MVDNVPASPNDAVIERAILSRVVAPTFPYGLPDSIRDAIMSLEVGASQADQDKVREMWAEYKVQQARDAEPPTPPAEDTES